METDLMAKLLVKIKAEIIKNYIIPGDKNSITIGSESDNDLVITDKKISMNHLKVSKNKDGYSVEDLKSAFGTIVNGHTLRNRTAVTDGDEIKIGQHTLIFLDDQKFLKSDTERANVFKHKSPDTDIYEIDTFNFDSEVNTNSNDSENIEATSINFDTDRGSDKVALSAAETRIAGTIKPGVNKYPKAGKSFYLLAIYGPYRGKKFQLNKVETRIGRDTRLNEIIIQKNSKGEVDSSISRRHATIVFNKDDLYITDKRSKTRTYVNQYKLTESDSLKLVPGDEIEIVSDQQSTIFRLVKEGDWDFSPVKKAGVWWIRYRTPGLKLLTALILIISLITLITSIKKRHLISQRPDPLSFTEKIWYQSSSKKSFNDYLESFAEDSPNAALAIGDLDGDNVIDCVFLSPEGVLTVINGDTKTQLWLNKNPIYCNKAISPVLADLNGNGLADIILVTQSSRFLAVDGKTGAEIWRSQLLGGQFTGRPAVADVNRDIYPDVAIAATGGNIYVAYGSSTEPRLVNIEVNDSLRSIISAGDTDGDGYNEFLLGTESGFIFLLNGLKLEIKVSIDLNEKIAAAGDSANGYNSIRTPVAIGHLNDDVYDDLLVSTMQGNLFAIDGKTKKLLWDDILLSQTDLISDFYFPAAIADLNNDKLEDVVIFTLDGRIKAYRGSGNSASRKEILWEYNPDDWEKYIASPGLADINKDGIPDIIASGYNAGLHVIDGSNGKLIWRTQFQGQNPPKSSPLIADLEGDSFLDILIQRADNSLYMYSSNARCPKNLVLWAQEHNNAENTSRLTRAVVSASGYNLKIILSLFFIVLVIGIQLISIVRRKKLA